jgi:hypothetical protein
MSNTRNLALPLLAAAQAQKHVTHNEALIALDALVHLSVMEANRIDPPDAPAEGDRYLLGEAPTGIFAGHDGQIAIFDQGLWHFMTPRRGWRTYVEVQDLVLVYDGAGWHPLKIDRVPLLGIGTDADTLNRFAAKLNATLFTALAAAEGGTGDLRFVLNKEAAANVLSQLYQSGYGGRAETGLVGDDDFRIRVSPDGSAWRDAMRVDRTTGEVAFPCGVATQGGFGNLLINADLSVNQRVFAGGALAAGTYGYDRWKAGPGGCSVTVTGDGIISLTGPLVQIIEAPHLAGQAVTVSVDNPNGPLTVSVDAATGTIPAGAGRRSVTLTVPASATGNIAVTLTGSGVTFARTVINRGPWVEPFARIPPGLNLLLCQRYYAKTFRLDVAPTSNAGMAGCPLAQAIVANVIPPVRWQLPVAMRAVPNVTYFNPLSFNANWSIGGVAATTVVSYSSNDSIRISYSGSATISVGSTTAVHAVADAEL